MVKSRITNILETTCKKCTYTFYDNQPYKGGYVCPKCNHFNQKRSNPSNLIKTIVLWLIISILVTVFLQILGEAMFPGRSYTLLPNGLLLILFWFVAKHFVNSSNKKKEAKNIRENNPLEDEQWKEIEKWLPKDKKGPL